MASVQDATVHASCVLVGRGALLIRGPQGSGKSWLALDLIAAGHIRRALPAWLVADDRVHLSAAHGRLLAAAPEPIRGLIEVHGFGLQQVDYEPRALVCLAIDLAAEDAARMPEGAARETKILGVKLSRLPLAPYRGGLAPVLAAISAVTQA
jgi:serine kinase of HPr protein (carbohydrate metabolism regulator)